MWVLAGAVNDRAMYIGYCCIVAMSVLRFVVYRRFRAATDAAREHPRWAVLAVVFSGASGLLWGSAAIVLYPPLDPAYQLYLVLLFALIPLVPIAALAVYLPTFYAYYLPCALPFLLQLAMQRDRVGLTSAALLLMLMAATVTFARKYYADFFEAMRLRLLVEEQRDAVQAASESKSAFLAAASHDLRQPLFAITLFAEALEADLPSQSARVKQRGVLESSAALRSLLDRLLDVAQLDAGGIMVNNRDFALDEVLQKLGREFAPLALDRGLTVRVVPTRRWVRSDPELMENLLRNLVSNSLRYTHAGGVLLGCRKQGERLIVQVTDTGIGIEREHRQRIFEEFYQVNNRARDREKGLGLGLAVVRRIAHLLGTEVQLSSVTGRGSTFRFAVPAARAQENTVPTTPRVALDRVLRGQRVLFVDNDADIRAGFRGLATTWGCEPLLATGKEDALRLTDTELPDAMILDYGLPEPLSGVQLAFAIEERAGRRIPTLIISGDTTGRSEAEAASVAYLYARKPLGPGNLRALLVRLLA